MQNNKENKEKEEEEEEADADGGNYKCNFTDGSVALMATSEKNEGSRSDDFDDDFQGRPNLQKFYL